jgi:hypothetical protein
VIDSRHESTHRGADQRDARTDNCGDPTAIERRKWKQVEKVDKQPCISDREQQTCGPPPQKINCDRCDCADQRPGHRDACGTMRSVSWKM